MNEKNKIYGTKALTLTISDSSVSESSGERKVKGYLSAFDVMDSDRDIVRRGAFTKSIKENGPASMSNRRIQFLRNHDWNSQIGKFLELVEDEKGLMFTATLGTSSKGNDAFLDYQQGIIREHSIGFNYVQDKITMVNDKDGMAQGGGYWEVKEVQLWEGSAVTFGANEFTPVVDVSKGLTTESFIESLNSELIAITKALKEGQGTDERLQALEMRLKILGQKYNNALQEQKQPPVKALIQEEQPQFDTGNFYRLLIQ